MPRNPFCDCFYHPHYVTLHGMLLPLPKPASLLPSHSFGQLVWTAGPAWGRLSWCHGLPPCQCLCASLCSVLTFQCSHPSACAPVLTPQCSHSSTHAPVLTLQCSHSSAHAPVPASAFTLQHRRKTRAQRRVKASPLSVHSECSGAWRRVQSQSVAQKASLEYWSTDLKS